MTEKTKIEKLEGALSDFDLMPYAAMAPIYEAARAHLQTLKSGVETDYNEKLHKVVMEWCHDVLCMEDCRNMEIAILNALSTPPVDGDKIRAARESMRELNNLISSGVDDDSILQGCDSFYAEHEETIRTILDHALTNSASGGK